MDLRCPLWVFLISQASTCVKQSLEEQTSSDDLILIR